jgi:hypothetical protein
VLLLLYKLPPVPVYKDSNKIKSEYEEPENIKSNLSGICCA